MGLPTLWKITSIQGKWAGLSGYGQHIPPPKVNSADPTSHSAIIPVTYEDRAMGIATKHLPGVTTEVSGELHLPAKNLSPKIKRELYIKTVQGIRELREPVHSEATW